MVLTGDAGDPADGRRPGFTGGQAAAHRAADDGRPGAARPPRSPALARPAACASTPPTSSLYVTDRTPTGDRLQRITKDSKVSTVWTWPDRPGIAGCAVSEGTVLVNLVNTKQTVAVRLAPDTGAVTGEPEVIRQDQHGHVWALQLSPDGNVWGATVNKTSGDAEKLDDVVFPLFPQGGVPAEQRRQDLTSPAVSRIGELSASDRSRTSAGVTVSGWRIPALSVRASTSAVLGAIRRATPAGRSRRPTSRAPHARAIGVTAASTAAG